MAASTSAAMMMYVRRLGRPKLVRSLGAEMFSCLSTSTSGTSTSRGPPNAKNTSQYPTAGSWARVRLSFFESTAQVPRRARSTGWLRARSLPLSSAPGGWAGPGRRRWAGPERRRGLALRPPMAWRLGVQVVAIDPRPRSGRRCGCGFHPLLSPSTTSISCLSATRPDRACPSRSRAAAAAESTRLGPTGCCSCAPATPSPTTRHTAWRRSSLLRRDGQAGSGVEGQGTAANTAPTSSHELPRRARPRAPRLRQVNWQPPPPPPLRPTAPGPTTTANAPKAKPASRRSCPWPGAASMLSGPCSATARSTRQDRRPPDSLLHD